LLRLTQGLVAAQLVARALADQIELALERRGFRAGAGPDQQLLDLRHRRARAVAEIGFLRARRHDPPAEQRLSLLRADAPDRGLATLALARVGRQEPVARGELAFGRQLQPKLALRDPREELARQRRDDPRAVARVLLRPARAAMIHAAEQVIRVEQDL